MQSPENVLIRDFFFQLFLHPLQLSGDGAVFVPAVVNANGGGNAGGALLLGNLVQAPVQGQNPIQIALDDGAHGG